MSYAKAIIKLVPQIRNVSGLKQLYGYAKHKRKLKTGSWLRRRNRIRFLIRLNLTNCT